jgi:hypothetical protein
METQGKRLLPKESPAITAIGYVEKILVGAWHRGGGQAVYPPTIRIAGDGHEIIPVIAGPSLDVFKDIPFKTPEIYGYSAIGREEARQILEAEQPSVLLIGTSSQDKDTPITLEQALTLAARERGIPTIAVLDFWGNYSRRFSDKPTYDNRKYLPDMICVPDVIAFNDMIGEGFDKDKLVVTGNPYFDDIAASKEQFTGDRRDESRKEYRRQVVLFASQPIELYYGSSMGYTEKTALEDLLSCIEEAGDVWFCPNTTIVIRPHPKEDPEELRAVADRHAVHYFIDSKTPLREAIMASDIVLSPFSTMLVDAALLGVPAISLQPGLCRDDLLPTNKLGITYPVFKQGEVGDAIKAFLSDTTLRKKFEEKSKSITPDGKATERVVREIYSLFR